VQQQQQQLGAVGHWRTLEAQVVSDVNAVPSVLGETAELEEVARPGESARRGPARAMPR
jgi:hypothetical protein